MGFGHELHHIQELLAGVGRSEQAAEAAGQEFLKLFLQRFTFLD